MGPPGPLRVLCVLRSNPEDLIDHLWMETPTPDENLFLRFVNGMCVITHTCVSHVEARG